MERRRRVSKRKYGDKYQDHFLEQYKLYVQMTEAATSRKEQTNRFYPTLFSALSALLLVAPRIELPDILGKSDSIYAWLMLIVGIMGVYLSATWYLSIRSYQRLIFAKYQIIEEMEERLPFGAYSQEDLDLSPSHRHQRVDMLLPAVFLLPFYGLVFYSLFTVLTSLD